MAEPIIFSQLQKKKKLPPYTYRKKGFISGSFKSFDTINDLDMEKLLILLNVTIFI